MEVLTGTFFESKQKSNDTQVAPVKQETSNIAPRITADSGARRFSRLTWKVTFPLLFHAHIK